MASSTLSALPISSSAAATTSSDSLRLVPSSLSLQGNKLPIRRFSSSSVVLKWRRPTVARISSSLPTTGLFLCEWFRWSARAIRSFGFGELEARKLKYPNTGTEAILMGILIEGTSSAAKFLRANGITFFKVRQEIVDLLGKSDLFFFSPEHPPLTEQAQRALDKAIEEKLKSGDDGEITPSHILLGLWSETDSAGQKILETLGFTNEMAKELVNYVDEGAALSSR
ncbi:unnamed protein product [Linum tenue]|uniref:Clp R domain-containing protein n=1 Tax=Linum tenue TaxID=586396 RepID=A0AAV0J349_9ROSI|nr:unnamed protein product [Linum tenue]